MSVRGFFKSYHQWLSHKLACSIKSLGRRIEKRFARFAKQDQEENYRYYVTYKPFYSSLYITFEW